MPTGRRKGLLEGLAQREQQAIDILYKYGPCTVYELQAHMGDKLNHSTVRTILRTLEKKKYVGHKIEGKKYIYHPLKDKRKAAVTTFKKLVDTFFSGSSTEAVSTFIDEESKNIGPDELDAILDILKKAKDEMENKK